MKKTKSKKMSHLDGMMNEMFKPDLVINSGVVMQRKKAAPTMQSFEEWAESDEGTDFDEDVLQYMGDSHGHETHTVEDWNQIASECQMSVAFP